MQRGLLFATLALATAFPRSAARPASVVTPAQGMDEGVAGNVGGAEGEPTARQVGTCLEIRASWPPAYADSLVYLPPPRVRLDSIRAEPGAPIPGASEVHRLVDVSGSLPSVHRRAFWRPRGDSLTLTWTTGTAALTLHVPLEGDTLRGRMALFYDDGKGSTAPGTAIRVPCDAPLPSSERRRRSTPLSVPLTGGGALGIGAKADASWPAASERLRVDVPARAAGPYAGAERVQVEVDGERRIREIRLTYPDSVRASELVTMLTRLYGVPHGDPRPGRHVAAWVDRETWITVLGSPLSPGPRVILADPKWAWAKGS